MLFALHDMMITLEEAAPGVPFRELLASTGPDATPEGLASAAALLLSRGLTPREVDDTLGPLGDEARLTYAFRLKGEGVALSEIEQRTGVPRLRLYQPSRPAYDAGQKILARLRALLDEGSTVGDAAKKLNISTRTAYRYMAGDTPASRPAGKTGHSYVTIAQEVIIGCRKVADVADDYKVGRSYVYQCVAKYQART